MTKVVHELAQEASLLDLQATDNNVSAVAKSAAHEASKMAKALLRRLQSCCP